MDTTQHYCESCQEFYPVKHECKFECKNCKAPVNPQVKHECKERPDMRKVEEEINKRFGRAIDRME